MATDLSPLIRNIEANFGVLNANVQQAVQHIAVVSGQVETVAQQQADTRQRLEQLYDEFQEYIEKDLWANEVSTARQELTLIRQELETKFGHYAEVRRHATGILQATDVAI